MRILITTDNHVGYNEQDATRGDDAAITFDEIMRIAHKRNVDMVLQGGDLFHINKPSKRSLYDVVKSLRKYCLSDKPIEFEVLHHGQLSLDRDFDHVNFEDPNINVGIPLFAISGNHDDRGGAVLLSPLDMLAATGLINYFGRVLDNDEIEVEPILIQKGDTKIAIYGLSNVRDERLHRTFINKKVKFLVGPDQDSFFNILVVHQNRAAHSQTNYLPESFIPEFVNMVVWGHEHECKIDPERSTMGFEIMQPGSSVATSLCEGEAKQKFIAILDIKGKHYQLEKVPLATVRPFKMRTVVLTHDTSIKPGRGAEKLVTEWMREQVEKLIVEAMNEWRELNPGQDEPPLPLIRLRVDYSGGYNVENPTRFSNRFSGRVANANDVVQYMKQRQSNQKSKPAELAPIDTEAVESDKAQLSELVHQFLQQQSLRIIPEKGMATAIAQFVDQDDKAAMKAFVDVELKRNVDNVTGNGVDNDLNATKGKGVKSAPVVVAASDDDESMFVEDTPPPRAKTTAAYETDSDFAVDSDGDVAPISSKKKPRTPAPTKPPARQTRAPLKAPAKRQSKGAAQPPSRIKEKHADTVDIIEIASDSEEETSAPVKKTIPVRSRAPEKEFVETGYDTDDGFD